MLRLTTCRLGFEPLSNFVLTVTQWRQLLNACPADSKEVNVIHVTFMPEGRCRQKWSDNLGCLDWEMLSWTRLEGSGSLAFAFPF